MTREEVTHARHVLGPAPEAGRLGAVPRAWDPGEAQPPGFQRAYHARNIRDEDEVISFGLFEMSQEEYRRWREAADTPGEPRIDRLSAFVENDHVSGVYEVIDVLESYAPPRRLSRSRSMREGLPRV